MSLTAGWKLLHYVLVEKIGEGGMGVVWKARDTTLDRDVALKVLPNQFLDDPDRRARFEREAKLLASLRHANIAGIFGLHEAPPLAEDGTPSGAEVRFITMELVPGEDLAQRLARGALPLEQSLGVARKVAEALETAHDSGVIHRDLKPANIKLGPDEEVKVLDFGLAKAFEADPSGVDPRVSLSPTLTTAGTRAGVLLGTAAYMSPEQARGYKVDKRADIFAFGAVLYEFLTGRQAFGGETISDSLASVLKIEPDWSLLPAETPEAIRRLLGRCLEKRPKQRLRDIGEARIRIEEELGIQRASTEASASAAPGPLPTSSISGLSATSYVPGGMTAPGSESLPGGSVEALPARSSRLPWLVAGIAVIAALASIGWLFLGQEAGSTTAQVIRLNVQISAEDLARSPGAQAVLSPDGTRIAYVAGPDDLLHIRMIDQFEGTVLSGTSGAQQPFFSPDGRWIAFFAGSKLKKVAVVGGAPLTLCDVDNPRGGSWGPDDTIVFAPDTTSGLFRVSSGGGVSEELTLRGEEVRSHRWPHFLPGGRALLFTVQEKSMSFDEARIEVLDLEENERRELQHGGSNPAYVPTGHLVYVHEGTMFAAAFDLETLEVTGSANPVLEEIDSNANHGGARYSFSPAGHLLYTGGGAREQEVTLSWLDRDGTRTPALAEPREYRGFLISPDGTKLAVILSSDSSNTDVWVHDFDRDTLTRLTFSEEPDGGWLWSPDGERIYFSSERHGAANVYSKRADGTGEVERLHESDLRHYAMDVGSDGKTLLVAREHPDTGWDILLLDSNGDGEPTDFLVTAHTEIWSRLSPDGRWVAYLSDESGEAQIYVRPFPQGPGKWQISTDGATGPPGWSRDGNELFYRRADDLLVATVSGSGKSFVAERPRVLFEDVLGGNRFLSTWVAHPDGRRFLVTDKGDSETGDRTHAILVLNWFEELQQRAPR